jgi:hypothetical protein
MHDDDALALAAHLVLGGGGEAVPEELRAVMRVDVALVHVDEDGCAILLLFQRCSVSVDVATLTWIGGGPTLVRARRSKDRNCFSSSELPSTLLIEARLADVASSAPTQLALAATQPPAAIFA